MTSYLSSTQSPAVAVYCASSLGNEKAYQLAAMSLGQALAAANRPLVYGGGRRGIMGVISSTVMNSPGGQVTGVIPHAILAGGGERGKDPGVAAMPAVAEALRSESQGEMETIIVESMHERKVKMAERVGGFIGLPGGYGTFEEILEVITWNQLNIHNKPVVVLNVLSYFSPLRELVRNGVREGFIVAKNENLVIFVDGPEDQTQHETFDWGTAALNALTSWQSNHCAPYPIHWSKESDVNGKEKYT
ncbi:hypothetical protein BJ138DRAFT_1139374 [Hygrophoropsis aurantiaca]|uniref:Uncharacterized protein n=1 Tax=Hygrophoropsis aurantiaca TaxID=72124 RepID=A0ACB8AUS0_9AGAM|nr:hypothetical protein BJ138DRAFT_1139374 [Hygrophoropsis aurantiaca]